MAKRSAKNNNGKKLPTQQSVDAAIWSICDIMRRGNIASALQYVPELTWILFLRILDETKEREALEANALGQPYTPSLVSPYRWTDWARPIDVKAPPTETNKRRELSEQGTGKFLEFVNTELIPHLKKLRDKPDATQRQKVIAEFLYGVERVRIDNPHRKVVVDTRTPAELLDLIEAKGVEVASSLALLRQLNAH